MIKKEFTATEVMMLMEKIQKEFRVVAEVVTDLKDRIVSLEIRLASLENTVDSMFEMIVKNTEDIEMIKIDILGVKKKLKEINTKLDRKTDANELAKIDKRVTFLENKLKAA